MFWFYFKLIFLVLYFGLTALITYLVYKEENKYYKSIYVEKKGDDGKEKTTYLHDEFDVFTRRDKPINIIMLFLGFLLMGWIKLLSSLMCAVYLSLILKKKFKEKNNKFDKEDIEYMKKYIKLASSYFLNFSCIFSKEVKLPDEIVLPVYQKYFGPDYKIDYEGKFGGYICNHTSFNDILLTMKYYAAGFVSKAAVRDIPIIGRICEGLQSIYVERNDPNSRKVVLDKIEQKQKDFYEGTKPLLPFMVFPEGTTTSGRHLLKFKKGAFSSLLPLKPNIIHPNLNKDFHLGCGSTDVGMNYLRSLSYLFNRIEFIKLPIMTPNEYMFTNFSHLGSEKWEIYAEVSREIMCELGGFQKSDKTLRDSYRYTDCIKQKKWIEKEKPKTE